MTAAYIAGTQVDHYEIICLMGHGGMNRVYLSHDQGFSQKARGRM
jgi:eukaryotic-like serine/threonine-protein kinase